MCLRQGSARPIHHMVLARPDPILYVKYSVVPVNVKLVTLEEFGATFRGQLCSQSAPSLRVSERWRTQASFLRRQRKYPHTQNACEAEIAMKSSIEQAGWNFVCLDVQHAQMQGELLFLNSHCHELPRLGSRRSAVGTIPSLRLRVCCLCCSYMRVINLFSSC